jgi:hypothetical protein
MRKKTVASTTTTTNSNISRPSLIDTMLLTSTPLRRSPAIQSTTTSTRSATNLTLQQIFKEKNQTYEDMQLLNLTKSMNKKKEKKSASTNKNIKKRSRSRRTVTAEEEDDDDETENDQEIQTRKKPMTNKRKTTVSKQQQQSEEPNSKKLRRTDALNNKRTTKTPIGKSSAGSSDGCTTADEENEETRLIQQSKLYIEGPGKSFFFLSLFESSILQVFDKITKKLMNIIQESVKKFKVFVLINKFHRHYHHLFFHDQLLQNKM